MCCCQGRQETIGCTGKGIHINQSTLYNHNQSGPYRNSKIWKLPTGLVDQGEDIHLAARREVLEETGITSDFREVLCFRQMHNYALFGKSDLFFVCMLNARSTDIQRQEAEIADCMWMDPEEYFNQPFFLASEVFCRIHDTIRSAMKNNNKDRTLQPIKQEQLSLGYRPGQVSVFHSFTSNS